MLQTEAQSVREKRGVGPRLELAIVACLLAILFILSWFSPADRTLGNAVKLVYLHGAVVWGSLLMFALAALFGLAGILGSGSKTTRYAFAAAEAAVVFWLVHVLLSVIVTWWSWGGIYWQEPRFQMALVVMAISVLLFPAILLFRTRLFTNLISLVMGVIVYGLLVTSGKVMHPANPIGSSDALSVKAFFTAIVVVVVAISVEYFRLAYPSRRAAKAAGAESE